MQPVRRWQLGVLLLALGVSAARAGQDIDSSAGGGLNVRQDLRHRVVIPQIIYFRIGSGSPGLIEEVRINVGPGLGNNQPFSGSGAPAVADGTPVGASTGALEVEIRSNVGTVNLSYDLSNPLGLSDGAGNYLPFDDIIVDSGDPGGLPAPVLSNSGGGGASSVAISGNLFSGRVIRRQTLWTYAYANRVALRAGTYNGRVRYTVAAP